ncbi:MAG: heterodisulfide reductase-related iron-sulfur binding cluster [Bacteroidales bacterium]|nr:heterodisulfide reductase-related iron-sulfur binding cluster [Bacteroidales bacterium]
MIKQLIFLIVLLITLTVFAYSMMRYFRYFKFTKKYPIHDFGKRLWITIKIAFLQQKILRRPVVGLMHSMVWWGFIVILFGSIEMVIDGLFGTEKILFSLGPVYNFLMASGDVFGLVIALAILAFLFRRLLMHIKRFYGPEMKPVSKADANLALIIILVLMISLLGMNTFYVAWSTRVGGEVLGVYPVSQYLAGFFKNMVPAESQLLYQINWWTHIVLIFIFANILPYSKHFHVFMSVPNVFVSKIKPLGTIDNMENITKEVKLMLNPDTAFAEATEEDGEPERFGAKDVQDLNWVNYLNSLSCTECGRCTSVCPANITGKLLSPRKIMMDTRARMKEKGPGMLKEGVGFDDGRSLLTTFITEEELWACTMCNACVQECPVNINQPAIILDMRRYLVMEESKAPSGLNSMFANIENNGAPWQFSAEDRMNWAEGLEVPLIADKTEKPEFLLWVSSAGAFDDRYKKVMRAFVGILNHLKVDYAVLGVEESDSGDVARRTGNEMLFQMQALTNIEVLNSYEVKKILTCDPHDFNTLKNEYGDLGGHYEVTHHSQFLQQMIDSGKINPIQGDLANKKITYHDPCYLGRANGEYEAPRSVLNAIPSTKTEMKRNKSFGLCCGAGGGQMFKEAEKGTKEVFIERTEEALATGCDIIATACPFCMTMMTDGIKYKNKEESVKNYDIAELVSMGLGLG